MSGRLSQTQAAGFHPVAPMAAFALAALLAGPANAAAPTLTHVFPPGGQRGTTVTVKCHGKFDWPVSISAPGVEAVPGKDAGQLELTIPAELAADRVWIRLHNAEGASAATPFLIGSLKDVVEQEPNNSPGKAQAIADPAITINGFLDKSDVDGFAVDLAAGETLVAALEANTMLDSPIDAILQVATEAGFVLAENHDAVGLDPRLAYTAPQAGRVIVRVFAFPSKPDSSIRYFGSEACIYRLTLTTGPFITHAAPLSVPQAEPGSVEVFGWNIPPGTTLPVLPINDGGTHDRGEFEPQGDLRLASGIRPGIVFAPGFGGSARVRLTPYASASTVSDGSDAPSEALSIPGAVTGLLARPKEVDRFRFPLTKGQKLILLGEGREQHFPVDLHLRLLDPAGGVAAILEEPSRKRVPLLNHTAAREGQYELEVRDRYRTGGERSFYQVTARLDEPDFELTLPADAAVVSVDKPAELTVNVQRRGSGVGPITIQAAGLPEGVTAEPVVSEIKGDTASKVKLKLVTSGAAFSGPIRVEGTAGEPTDIRRLARTAPRLGTCFESLWLTAVPQPAGDKPAAESEAGMKEAK